MKILLYLIFVTIVGVACSSKNEPLTEASSELLVDGAPEEFTAFDWDTLKGLYIGDFAGSDIRINITYVSNKNVVGYNIHKGLMRNISGKIIETQDSIILKMDEPGDNEFDGTFQILVNRKNLKINASWVPFSKKLTPKAFTLKKIIQEPYDEHAKITNANFTNYYNFIGDSLGDMQFEDDGFVTYSYYPANDERRKEQLVEVKGSWAVKDKQVIVNWQENAVFPTKKSVFKIVQDEYSRLLVGEGRELSDMYGAW